MPLPLRSTRNAGLAAVVLIVLATGCSRSLPTSPVADPSGAQQSVGTSSAVMDPGTEEWGNTDGSGSPSAPPAPEVTPITLNDPPLGGNNGHGHAYGKKKHNN